MREGLPISVVPCPHLVSVSPSLQTHPPSCSLAFSERWGWWDTFPKAVNSSNCETHPAALRRANHHLPAIAHPRREAEIALPFYCFPFPPAGLYLPNTTQLLILCPRPASTLIVRTFTLLSFERKKRSFNLSYTFGALPLRRGSGGLSR